MPEFVASLPLVAVDGTMRKRLNGAEIAGQAHIKTGSLAGVRAIAGYVLDARGRLDDRGVHGEPRARRRRAGGAGRPVEMGLCALAQ